MDLNFCTQTSGLWQVVGHVYGVIKIAIPAVLIILCIFLIAKAIFTHDEKESKKIWQSILWKIILAIVIFFIPTIVSAIFNFVNGFKEIKDDYSICKSCITSPKGDKCTKAIEAASKES